MSTAWLACSLRWEKKDRPWPYVEKEKEKEKSGRHVGPPALVMREVSSRSLASLLASLLTGLANSSDLA